MENSELAMTELNKDQVTGSKDFRVEKLLRTAFTVCGYLASVILWVSVPFVFQSLRQWQKSAYTIKGTDVETWNTGKNIEEIFGGPEKMEVFFVNWVSITILGVLFAALVWILIKITIIKRVDDKTNKNLQQ